MVPLNSGPYVDRKSQLGSQDEQVQSMHKHALKWSWQHRYDLLQLTGMV
jgi:hypothetical protein